MGCFTRHRLSGLALATMLMVSGCVATGPLDYIRNGFKVGPNYCRPPAPVAADWIEANDPKVVHDHLDEWWSVFNDPALNGLIDTAYDQNLTLRVVGTRVLQARAQQAIAVGNILPQSQQATGQYSRVNLSPNMPNNPAALGPTVQTIENRLGIPPTPSFFTNAYSDWTAGFNLSWELDF
ncbi:MAG: hypothetical protein K2R98_14720 [Gemmataceae bacterium]|nr:hypothetical protein [Gemmataceae bacterium]